MQTNNPSGIILGPGAPSEDEHESTLYRESSSTEEIEAFKSWGGNKVFINQIVDGCEQTCTENTMGELPADPLKVSSNIVCTHKLKGIFNTEKVTNCKSSTT